LRRKEDYLLPATWWACFASSTFSFLSSHYDSFDEYYDVAVLCAQLRS